MKAPNRKPAKADGALIDQWITNRAEECADTFATQNLIADNLILMDRHDMDTIAEWDWEMDGASPRMCILRTPDHPAAATLRSRCERAGIAINVIEDAS